MRDKAYHDWLPLLLNPWNEPRFLGFRDTADIKWNFEKFLVNPQGETIARWGTRTTPEDIAAELADLMG